MEVKILGTAAAEGIPALFCNCETCEKSRLVGGKNIRSRSSILIDNILKIDLPPDTFHHSVRHNMDTAKLRYLLITHSHHDHFAKDELLYLKSGFATRNGLPKLQIYGNKDVLNMIPKPEDLPLDCHSTLPFKTYDAGEYKITTLKAKHGVDENPLNYIIEKDEKVLLYTCDSGYYDDETWSFLSSQKIKIDTVISECTGGPKRVNYKFHMGLPNVCEFRKKANEFGLSGADTNWLLTHFTHNNGATYDEFLPIAKAEGFNVAYDGMTFKI
jgi:phosphoribosyl 1,2-cyclic phosphate phosphodiesterase